jgi:HD-GYP domain-containing protein (c-di-GMP phosphodiesterase class II)
VINPLISLCGVSPEIKGLRWESANLLRIGRQPSFEVVINHPSVSRQHAEVILHRQGGAVRDLGSRRGTFLNGSPIGRAYQKLKHQDMLQCGDILVQVAIDGEPKPLVASAPSASAAAEGEDGTHIKSSGTFLKIQATTQHSWEQALEVPTIPVAEALVRGNHLLGLARMSYHLCHIHSLDELLQSILDDAVVLLDAQRGCIVLADEGTGQLSLHAIASSRHAKNTGRVFSNTLTTHCYQQGKSLLCRDARVERQLQEAGSISHGAMASIICSLLHSPRKRLGVLHLDRGPLQQPFSEDDFYLADAIAASLSYGIENAQLMERQRELFMQAVTALAQSVEMRDQYTGNHTQRVTQYSLMLARELQLPACERNQIQIATPLHDIGKIAINDAILRKPGKLTPEEFAQMQTHGLRGAAILEPIPGLRAMIPIVRNHHERWDGTGYPDYLAGERIPRMARIVAVADAFDAMTSDRPYRLAMPLDKAFAELQSKAGIHFDPECVTAFLRLRPRIAEVHAHQSSSVTMADALTESVLRNEMNRLLNQGPLEGLLAGAGNLRP